MEITDIAVTNVSAESWREFVEFPLVAVLSEYERGERRR
jgi:hypothetical protein